MSEPFGYFKAELFGWTDCAETDEGAVALYEHPPLQQEVDLSGLKPTTQEVVKGWIEDGTFIKRAIGAMQEQEAENMRLEKMVKDQPAQDQIISVSGHEYPPKPTGIEAMVCNEIAMRQKMGLAKYGTTVADNQLSLREWLQHQYEELLDAAVYCRRAIAEIDKQSATVPHKEDLE